jgi:2-polyprenyl-6-methoxyphenol hydroxylase-like FAD-dependent oxidoreductase
VSYDAIVVGAGPVGCVAARALARRGARVALIEASPATRTRFAGELLHPGAVDVLRALDLLDVPAAHDHPANHGFAVSLRPGDAPVRLAYPRGATGWTFPFVSSS